MWRVLTDFADLADGGHVYRAGDNYPRAGKPDPARAAELAGRSNKRGVPLIEHVDRPEGENKHKKPRKKPE